MRFLKIFGWFLLTFGVVLMLATLIGFDLGLGPRRQTLMLLAIQTLVGALISLLVRAGERGVVHRTLCILGGWGLLGALLASTLLFSANSS